MEGQAKSAGGGGAGQDARAPRPALCGADGTSHLEHAAAVGRMAEHTSNLERAGVHIIGPLDAHV